MPWFIAAPSKRTRPRSQRSQIRRRIIRTVIILLALDISAAGAQNAPALSSAVVRGSTVYSSAELFPVYRAHLGKAITRDSARAIVQGIVEKYTADGYSRPQVQVDDNMTAYGVLRVTIIEPRIGSIEISGDPGPYRERLESISAELKRSGPLRQDELQAVMRRLRELPGLSLSATTARDTDDLGAYELGLDTNFEPIGGAVRLTNRGTDEIGPNFMLGQVVANGLLNGRTNMGVLFGTATDYDEYRGLGLLTDVSIGRRGMRTSVTGFRSRSDPRETGVDRDDTYVRDRLALRVTKPLRDRQGGTMSFTAALELEDLAIERSGTVLRDERLRMLETGARWLWGSTVQVQSAGTLDLVKGLDAFGAGLFAPDLAADARREDFTLLRGSYTRLMRLGARWTTRLDAFAQLTAHVLPYSERFKIGGDRLGRGFEVAEIAGDSGVGAKVELRRSLPGAPSVLGRASAYGFYDVGAAWKEDLPGRESAATAGLGFAVQGRRTSGLVELAKPLTHPDVEGRDSLALFLELTVRL
jgi:hemolysin activation/secretion protein